MLGICAKFKLEAMLRQHRPIGRVELHCRFFNECINKILDLVHRDHGATCPSIYKPYVVHVEYAGIYSPLSYFCLFDRAKHSVCRDDLARLYYANSALILFKLREGWYGR